MWPPLLVSPPVKLHWRRNSGSCVSRRASVNATIVTFTVANYCAGIGSVDASVQNAKAKPLDPAFPPINPAFSRAKEESESLNSEQERARSDEESLRSKQESA